MTSILKVNNLNKTYDKKPILRDINFELHEQEIMCILGPSGSGKSTLLRLISGLESFDTGSIETQHSMGMVFQNYELFPHLSVIDNLILAPTKVHKRTKSEATTEAISLLKRFGLEDKKDAYPHQLSGGQKQRIAIIRTLINHPTILLLDEITAALDPEMVKEVLEIVLELAQDGLSMLIVTHEISFARAIADTILFLDDAQIIEKTPTEQFFSNPQTNRAKQFIQQLTYTKKERK